MTSRDCDPHGFLGHRGVTVGRSHGVCKGQADAIYVGLPPSYCSSICAGCAPALYERFAAARPDDAEQQGTGATTH